MALPLLDHTLALNKVHAVTHGLTLAYSHVIAGLGGPSFGMASFPITECSGGNSVKV